MWRHSLSAVCLLALLQVACVAPQPGVAAGAAKRSGDLAADLILRDVAFARLAEGRIAASGTAATLRYQREGGRFVASAVSGLVPEGSRPSLQALGALHLGAPRVDGELAGRQVLATATGGVTARAARGDHAETASASIDSAAGTIRSETPVEATGPGYAVRGGQLFARTDGSELRLFGGASGTLVPAPAGRAAEAR